jgi:hypothetical protein
MKRFIEPKPGFFYHCGQRYLANAFGLPRGAVVELLDRRGGN